MESHYKTDKSEIDIYRDFIIVRWEEELIKISHKELIKESKGEIKGGYTLVWFIEDIAEKKYKAKKDFCMVFNLNTTSSQTDSDK